MPTKDSTTTDTVTHTPEAFRYRRSTLGGYEIVPAVVKSDVDRERIATVTEVGHARLFAAAPKLLAALKALSHVAVWDEDSDRAAFDAAFAQAEAAIEQAERGYHPKYADVPRAEGRA